MSERKYMSHSSEECFINCTNHKTIKYGLVVHMGSRDEAVKQYNKYEIKWHKDLKDLRKHKNMLFSIAKKCGLR